MKKVFTLSFLALLTMQISFAQDLEPGFYPPEGSTFNADSSQVTLPDATVGEPYNEIIKFYASDTISMDIAGTSYALPFVSAVITNVSIPPGMNYSCNIENCVFTPNVWGEVTLSGISDSVGTYSLDLTATVTINAGPFGLPVNVTFPIPYDGSNAILNSALNDDYSAINSLVPAFILNVNESVGIEELNEASLSNLVVAPNPASTEARFTFYSRDADDLNLQVFDLLGNLIHTEQIRTAAAVEQTINLNTSSFNNGVYLYKLSSAENKFTGRLIVNK